MLAVPAVSATRTVPPPLDLMPTLLPVRLLSVLMPVLPLPLPLKVALTQAQRTGHGVGQPPA